MGPGSEEIVRPFQLALVLFCVGSFVNPLFGHNWGKPMMLLGMLVFVYAVGNFVFLLLTASNAENEQIPDAAANSFDETEKVRQSGK